MVDEDRRQVPEVKVGPQVLRSYDTARNVLLYDSKTGKYEEVPRLGLPDGLQETRGFYVKYGDDVVALFASSEGPVLFHNGEIIPLTKGQWRADVTGDGSTNTFQLFVLGAPRLKITYPAGVNPMVDSWSQTDADRDLFAWIQENADDPRFYAYYTDTY